MLGIKKRKISLSKWNYKLPVLIFILAIFLFASFYLITTKTDFFTSRVYRDLEIRLKIKYYRAMIDFFPKNYMNYHALGWVYYNSKNYEKSVYYFNESIRLRQNFSDGYVGMGWAHIRGNTLEWPIIRNRAFDESYYQSFIYFQKASELEPGNDKAYLGLGYTLLILGSPNKSIPYLQKAIELNPLNDKAYDFLGWAHYFNYDHEQAMESFMKSAEMNPENSDALYGIGRMYSLKKSGCGGNSRENAKEFFKKAIKKNSLNAEAHNGIAWLYYMDGDYSMASLHYKKALEVKPSHYLAMVGLGRVYLETGHREEAIKLFEKARSLNPSYREANEALAILHPDAEIGSILNKSSQRACPFSASIPFKV